MQAAKSPEMQQIKQWTYCVRRPSTTRQEDDGHTIYKKGHEVRFSIETKGDLRELRRCLKAVGLKPGREYLKSKRIIVPVYGKQAVEMLDR